jgi:uncharacterized caspase-like protein
MIPTRRLRPLVGLLAALCLALSALPALADRRVALVLGVDRYAALRPLDNPVNDSRAVTALLEDRLGFEATHAANRSLAQMRSAVADFAAEAAGADLAVLFFAGHGVEIAGRNYLLPADADPGADLAASALPLDEVVAALRGAVPNLVVILDACRDDPFALGASGQGRGATAMAPPPGAAPGLRLMGRSEGVVYAFAAAPGETASDGTGDNSPFTEAMLRHLATDGVDVRSALLLVQQDVYDRTRGAQLPYVESGLPRPLFLAEPAADLPARDRLLLAMAELSPDLRAQVERAAETHDTPLAPLYAAALEGDLARFGWAAREAKLAEAAAAFRDTRERLLGLESTDYRIRDLRAEAEALLERGERQAALARLETAIAIDAAAADANVAVAVERRISEADSRLARAGVQAGAFAYADAIADTEAAADLYARAAALARADARDAPRAALQGRVRALWELGDLHVTTGDSTAALAAFGRGRSLAEAVLVDAPADPEWRVEAATGHNRTGRVLLAQGDLDGAAQALTAGLAAFKRLAAEDPGNTDWQSDLAVHHGLLGEVFLARGDYAGAARAYDQARTIFAYLALHEPDRLEWEGEAAVASHMLATALGLQGDNSAAGEALTQGLVILARVADANPDAPRWQRVLAVALVNSGDWLHAQGRPEAAGQAYRESVRITESLAEQDPENAELQRGLALALYRLGDVVGQQGDLDAATGAYAESLALAERLAARDPGNAGWQSDLSVILGRVAEAGQAAGDLAAAERAQRRGLAIAKALATQEAANVRWRVALAAARYRMGQVLQARGGAAEAARHYADAIAGLEALAADGMLSSAAADWLPTLRAALAALPAP